MSFLKHRYIDPGTSLSEVLFGLIMTLTFTLGAGLMIQEEGREGARQMLIATIGCNIAWGIIDGALFLVGQLFDRGRLRVLGQAVRQASDVPAATKVVAGELDEMLAPVTTDAERSALYARIAGNLRSTTAAARNKIGKEGWLGAVASFWLVFLTSVPAAVPFLLIDEPHVALRVSNGVLLSLLFLTGYWWSRFTLGKPWLIGLSFLVGGVALVAVAIALGG